MARVSTIVLAACVLCSCGASGGGTWADAGDGVPGLQDLARLDSVSELSGDVASEEKTPGDLALEALPADTAVAEVLFDSVAADADTSGPADCGEVAVVQTLPENLFLGAVGVSAGRCSSSAYELSFSFGFRPSGPPMESAKYRFRPLTMGASKNW